MDAEKRFFLSLFLILCCAPISCRSAESIGLYGFTLAGELYTTLDRAFAKDYEVIALGECLDRAYMKRVVEAGMPFTEIMDRDQFKAYHDEFFFKCDLVTDSGQSFSYELPELGKVLATGQAPHGFYFIPVILVKANIRIPMLFHNFKDSSFIPIIFSVQMGFPQLLEMAQDTLDRTYGDARPCASGVYWRGPDGIAFAPQGHRRDIYFYEPEKLRQIMMEAAKIKQD